MARIEGSGTDPRPQITDHRSPVPDPQSPIPNPQSLIPAAKRHSPPVASLVWNLIRGGTEGQCARVAMACAALGDTHRVAVFRREGFFLGPVEAACGPLGELPIQRLASPATLKHLAAFTRWLRTERIRLLHAWDADAAMFGAWAARRAGIPLLTSRRDLGDIYAPWKLRLMRRADRQARGVVVNARRIAEGLIADGLPPEKIHRIPNLMDIAEFDRLAQESAPEGLPHGPFAVMVARLDPEKDGNSVVRAASIALATCPDWNLVVAGDGPERPALEALARSLPGGDRIRFLGDVKAVPALLSRASLGVLLPSANEGLSNSILEYMAAGLPSVVTDCGGNAELVADGETGRVVAPGDHAAAGEAMAILMRDEGLRRRLGLAARRSLEDHFRPQAVVAQFRALYAQAAP